MSYTKIVQFGNITEIYEYENTLKTKGIDHVKAEAFLNGVGDNGEYAPPKKPKKTKKTHRTKRSIKRSRDNFFRLCHHNNCLADTITFVTLTFAYDLTYKKATQYVSEFMARIQKNRPEISLSYISVPELTKKGRYHFHLLVYDLPPQTAQLERKTRNFQRLFQRGYVDISPATYTSEGIAGYMAKYMAKALKDKKNEAERGYNCSRNIKKFYSVGGNSLSDYSDLIIPTEHIADIKESTYNVKILGMCKYKKITTII